MRIIGETHIDFMRYRALWLTISLVAVVAAISTVSTRGIRKGVEFAGGAQIIVRYSQATDLNDIRSRLADAGLTGVSVTTSKLTKSELGSAFEGTVAGVEGEDVIIRVALQEKGPAAGETG
ncbi:MAG: hypothetical protein D6718_13475, partial [Acidobacteria bacterium]